MSMTSCSKAIKLIFRDYVEIIMDYYHGFLKRSAARFVVCCMLALVPVFLFAAQKPAAESTQGTFSGDYVIYRDYSWKAPTWIGFLYYNDETYGAFIRTDSPEAPHTVSILFSAKVEKGQLVLTGQQISSSITSDDTFGVNYLMGLLPKLYELKTFPRTGKAPFGTATVRKQMEEFGGSVTLDFQSFVPLFHLKTITGAKKETVLELTEIGSINGNGESVFYGYDPVEPPQDTNVFTLNKAAKKETVTVSGIPLHLDSQWKKIADNSFLCGNTAFLTVSTVNIPPVESGNKLSVPEQLLRLLTSSSPYAKTLLPYTTVEGTQAFFTLTQSVYDVESKKISKDIKRCIKNKDGSFTIISLTVNSHAYSAEQAYFNGLF